MNIAFLTLKDSNLYGVQHAGVTYLPSPEPVIVGMLLLALQPAGVEFNADSSNGRDILHAAMVLATKAAHVVHVHANRKQRDKPELPDGLSLDTVRGWVDGALKLCPTDLLPGLTELMLLRLGPNPWCEAVH